MEPSKQLVPTPTRVVPATHNLPKNKFPKGQIGPQFVDRFMPFFETYWHRYKEYPSEATIIDEFGFTKSQVLILHNSKFWLKSLDRRGIARPTPEGVDRKLTPEQVAAIAVITNYADKRSIKARLESLGCTIEQLHGWNEDPIFKDELTRRAADTFANVAPVAQVKLAEQIERGNLGAIKFYFEITGQAETPETINLKRAMQTFIDVLQRHVDPEVLRKVKEEADVILGIKQMGDTNG